MIMCYWSDVKLHEYAYDRTYVKAIIGIIDYGHDIELMSGTKHWLYLSIVLCECFAINLFDMAWCDIEWIMMNY